MGVLFATKNKELEARPKDDEARRSWPKTLYEELRDMAAASFLVYVFGIILETARRKPDSFKGVEVHKSNGRIFCRSKSKSLPRTFTPEDVILIVQENYKLLQQEFPVYFDNPEKTIHSLQLLRNRAELSGFKKGKPPLTLVEYDDQHQQSGPVYAIAVDRINKRVTLTFRGTDNDLAFTTNWKANVNVIKSAVSFPEQLKGKLPLEGINMHSGFYRYLFKKQPGKNAKDPPKTKFNEILKVLRPILQANRGYKLYITGHSLGGALAIITAFFLSCDQRSIPKPVTCISFGSPRVGDIKFMRAVRTLEKTRHLRYCRVVNDNDIITNIPMVQYHHAGVQIRLFRNKHRKPVITYPKEGSLPNAVQSILGNSLLGNLNTRYDHSDYRERLETHRDSLWKRSLNDVYKDESITGFS